jgi:hypothetical protein
MRVRLSRNLVLVAIVAVHIAVVYVLDRGFIRPQTVRPVAMSVTFISEPRPLPARQEISPPELAPVRPRLLPSAPPIETPSEAITDWVAEAQRAAEDTVKREVKTPRAFTHVFPEAAAPDKPGLFGSQQQNRRAGRVDGGTDFWVSDNCYFEFPRDKPPPGSAGTFHLLTPTCKPPPTGGGGNLFKDLTPDDLKKPLPGEQH